MPSNMQVRFVDGTTGVDNVECLMSKKLITSMTYMVVVYSILKRVKSISLTTKKNVFK